MGRAEANWDPGQLNNPWQQRRGVVHGRGWQSRLGALSAGQDEDDDREEQHDGVPAVPHLNETREQIRGDGKE